MTVNPESVAARGHPSYVWRDGQERRLALVRAYAPLEQRRILDVGCGLGMYVRQFRQFSDAVYGVDIEAERVRQASQSLPNLALARGEGLPFQNETFDVVFLHEVLEHMEDDAQAVREAYRVLRPGGAIVIYVPNRLYLFETHGFFLGRRYIFKLLPLVNWLPDPLRRIFVPHVRAYLWRDLRALFRGLACTEVVHTYVYPGFDNIAARRPWLGWLLRKVLYALEHTPLRIFGLSHFLVMRKSVSR